MQIATPDDPIWQEAYEQLPAAQRDVFHAPGFAKACAAGLYQDHQVRCAIETDAPNGPIIYPFVERELGPMAPWSDTAQSLRDATGLYGRGGVVCASPAVDDLGSFHAELADHFQQRRIITSFDRYHPVLRNQAASDPRTEVRETGDFVVVSLAPDMEAIEASYKGKQRNTLRKAERFGVSVEFDDTGQSLDAFLEIHADTMKRQSAGAFYYFPRSFYETLLRELPENTLFANAYYEDEIVSMDLILYQGPYAHLFLSGTLPEHLDKSPNTKLKHESFRYLKERGVEHYLLGGGHKGQDGVYKYKRSFAPADATPSLIGCTVFGDDAYRELNREFEQRGALTCKDRFQFYEA